MDALADPDNINQFIILWLEENEVLPDNSNLLTDKQIPLLQNFTKNSPSKPADMVNIFIFYRNLKFCISLSVCLISVDVS